MISKQAKTMSRISKIPIYSYSSLNNTDRIERWTKILNSKATTTEGKAVMGQLSSLISYYNKPVDAQEQEIKWDEWSKQLETEGFVQKL